MLSPALFIFLCTRAPNRGVSRIRRPRTTTPRLSRPLRTRLTRRLSRFVRSRPIIPLLLALRQNIAKLLHTVTGRLSLRNRIGLVPCALPSGRSLPHQRQSPTSLKPGHSIPPSFLVSPKRAHILTRIFSITAEVYHTSNDEFRHNIPTFSLTTLPTARVLLPKSIRLFAPRGC